MNICCNLERTHIERFVLASSKGVGLLENLHYIDTYNSPFAKGNRLIVILQGNLYWVPIQVLKNVIIKWNDVLCIPWRCLILTGGHVSSHWVCSPSGVQTIYQLVRLQSNKPINWENWRSYYIFSNETQRFFTQLRLLRDLEVIACWCNSRDFNNILC